MIVHVARRSVLMTLAAVIASLSALTAVSAQEAGGADLAAVKAYVIDQAAAQKSATADFKATSEAYYELAEAAGFDYQALWTSQQAGLTTLLADAKSQWLAASSAYELNEGLVAGVPALSYFDVWLDAGPSGDEDPAEALDWTLALPNGEELERPGNFFHHLTEPLIWGTNDTFVGLRVDIDGDGAQELGEVMPEANLFVAAAAGLDDATAQLQAAIEEWEPTLEDAFAALVTMIPTMSEYFGQWKASAYVQGESSSEQAFVATSRLFDVNGIVHGLDVTYDEISPVVIEADPELHALIDAGFDELVGFVTDLYEQEQGGKRFTAEEAELYGSEAQAKATTLVGHISQAMALLAIEV